VHALDTIHAALRPQGLLLDVRPEPRHPWVEVQRCAAARVGERLERLGQVNDSYRHGTLAMADDALQTVIAAGRFARELGETFTFIYHFDSVDTWLTYLAEHWTSASFDPELIARAHAALPAGATGEVRILRDIHAARLRKR
jgi:hypothetical protein